MTQYDQAEADALLPLTNQTFFVEVITAIGPYVLAASDEERATLKNLAGEHKTRSDAFTLFENKTLLGVFDLLNRPVDSPENAEFLDENGAAVEALDSLRPLLEADQESTKRRVACILVGAIKLIKDVESSLLKKTPPPSYEEIATHVNPLIDPVRQLFEFFKAQDLLQSHFERSVTQKTRAKSGGKARAETFDPCRDYVLSQWEAHHQDVPNAQAARAIYRRIPKELLIKDDGAPLSVDPPKLFADWIRRHKATLQKSNRSA